MTNNKTPAPMTACLLIAFLFYVLRSPAHDLPGI